MANELFMWVVYKHPKDMPALFVARLWTLAGATESVVTAIDLEGVRAKLPPHLVRIGRSSEDDPCIVETWI